VHDVTDEEQTPVLDQWKLRITSDTKRLD
jgi:hypothetical protein